MPSSNKGADPHPSQWSLTFEVRKRDSSLAARTRRNQASQWSLTFEVRKRANCRSTSPASKAGRNGA